jgi:hypothetical protein
MQYFIAGPAVVNMLYGGNLVSTSKTLINNSLSVEVSSEDIRGGFGHQLFGKYFHTSALSMELEDSMWHLDWLAMALGSDIAYGADVMQGEELVLSGAGAGTLIGEPADGKVYITIKGTEVYAPFTVTAHAFTATAGFFGKTVCARYIATDASARYIRVSANIVPKEVKLIARCQLFNGSASDGTSATRVGYVDIVIPRFLLDGATTLSLTSTGAATTPLKGTALAVPSDECDDASGYYAEIIEILDTTSWFDNAFALIVPGGTVDVTMPATVTLAINAYMNGGGYVRLTNTDLTFTSLDTAICTVSTAGVVTGIGAGSTAIEFVSKDDAALVGSVLVEVV